jgi:FAD/FMN-containing dehydrogenase
LPAFRASTLEGFRTQQLMLVEDVRSLIRNATAMRSTLRTAEEAGRPQVPRSAPMPSPPVSELRDFAGEFYAALAQMDRAARSAVGAPLPHQYAPVPHRASPPPAPGARRASRNEDWEADEEETGPAERSNRRSVRVWKRRLLPLSRRNAKAIGTATNALTAALPTINSYVAESSYFQADWQRSYWGENYDRLKQTKKHYDPDGLFYVHHGIGSEEWSSDGFDRLRQ